MSFCPPQSRVVPRILVGQQHSPTSRLVATIKLTHRSWQRAILFLLALSTMHIGALAVAQLSSNSHESNANVIPIEPEKLQLEWLDNALKVSCTGNVHFDCWCLCKFYPSLVFFYRGIYCEGHERHYCMARFFIV